MPDKTSVAEQMPLAPRATAFAPGHIETEADGAPDLVLPWVVRLRYGMFFGGAATLGGVAWVFGLRQGLLWTLVPLVAVLITNAWLDRVTRRPVRAPEAMVGLIFGFDTICLTAVLGLTGGPMNPFSLLYLVQITLAAVVLKKEWTWVLVALAASCFGVLFYLHLSLHGSHVLPGEPELLSHLVGMWIAFIIAAALISFFTSRVSHALRLREQEVLALQSHVARQERLASLVTLAAGAAHELGTPLGTIAVVARELERYGSASGNSEALRGEALRDDARLIRAEVERCQRILQRMSADGAEPVGESAQPVEVGELFRQTLAEISEGRRAQVFVETANAEALLSLPMRATVQSLVALVANGLEAGRNTSVILRARTCGGQVEFSVCDNGCGMSEEILRRIAEPFFTTREPGKGMGLGTFLVRNFAERLGGGLAYESTPGVGTTARLTLPVEFTRHGEGSHAAV